MMFLWNVSRTSSLVRVSRMVMGLIKIVLLGWSMLRLMFGQGRGRTRLMFEVDGVLRLGQTVGLIVWSFPDSQGTGERSGLGASVV
ncbi:uncharacterized protein BDZ83DRAFT_643688 [Colletotrichum acutatum]|uniref:Uncharacterized protein n=1 Tax=Glomerella acutata TaxID=27357 RepID=A0AAD8U5I6_GLOAC|nr:uncharacterized protein BDZ83DRAFT_643688 [Colletotrichum acutatum]KAK1706290.1 hypothetical protein BDZ83DRAFT_643688 [Colletotrichum acutatum]